MAQVLNSADIENQPHVKDNDDSDEGIEVYDTPTKRSIYEKVHDMAEIFAATRIGQFVIDRADRCLRVIEETAKWGRPKRSVETNLQRPLTWPTFLALIMILRMLRIWLSIGAICIGNGPVTANDVIYFIQTRRRKLRAIRVSGLKEMRHRAVESRANSSNNTSADGILNSIRNFMSRAICRPGLTIESTRRIFIDHANLHMYASKQLDDCDRQTSKRPRDDEITEVDHNLSLQEMLNKYANESSGDDTDYKPDENGEDSDDTETSDATESGHTSEEVIEEENDETNNKKNTQDTNAKSDKRDDEVLIVKENGGRPVVPFIVKKEAQSDADSNNEQVQTPKENGPKSGQSEQRGKDVAKNSPPQEIHNLTNNTKYDSNTTTTTDKTELTVPNGSEEKSTPGHETAATTAIPQKLMPIINSTSLAASEIDVDDVKEKNEISTTTTSTYTSAPINIENIKSTSPTPIPHTPTITTIRNANENHLNPDENLTTLTPTSSSEDIFYSPIGSPDYNAYLNNARNMKTQQEDYKYFNNEMQSNGGGAGDAVVNSSTPVDNATTAQKKHVHYQTQNQRNQTDNQQQYQNRYRGNNRRR